MMKRAKIGDVFTVKVPNGFKILQWAYTIPKKGTYIRVFDGLYDTIPQNIANIVAGKHSFIISFNVSKAYRVGLFKRIDNYPVPDEYPFPDFMISFYNGGTSKIWKMDVMRTNNTLNDWQVFKVSRMEDLPSQFRTITLLNHCVTPNWLLYLFDINFNLSKPEMFFPALPGESYADKLQEYTDIVEQKRDDMK